MSYTPRDSQLNVLEDIRGQGYARSELDFTIASVASLSSGETPLNGMVPVGLWTPAAWTTASISFQVSRNNGVSFADAFDDAGFEIVIPSGSIPTAAARRFALNPRLFLGITNLRIRSGVTGTPVNQAAARSLVVVTRPIS